MALLDIDCPAGEAIDLSRAGSPGCVCRVEHNLIAARTDPTSLHVYCAGDYRTCPTWRSEKERIAADEKPLVRPE